MSGVEAGARSGIRGPFSPKDNRMSQERAFTLVELLVVVAIIALLLGILMPGLGRARHQARRVVCAARLREMGHGFHLYAQEHNGHVLPVAYTRDWPFVYWYGAETSDFSRVDPTAGLLWKYLRGELQEDGIFECPSQPPGTYEETQGAVRGAITSTYGYNGYYLSPGQTPGWKGSIGHRPWQNLDWLSEPQQVFTFADTMIEWGGKLKNCALLDPPYTYSVTSRTWRRNSHPTTIFRHLNLANVAHADGHVAALPPTTDLVTQPDFRIGSVGPDNGPHYVPDWREW